MFEVEIDDIGLRYLCDAQQSLLRGMEQLGKRGIPVGCRSGGCGVCKVRVIEGTCRLGKMSRACVSEQEAQEGVVLACRAYPESHVRVALAEKMQRCLNRGADGGRNDDGEEQQ
ncbi:2Fe-2S iron-sulfur cluster-binding protein [Pandoraea communis]|uniref:CadS n=1 Tax=Pandoraea communis TaxID=2508297 RepID=A0A5E4SF08_9BURK|nr:2Fe-2S iron-sulfur cluster binding domain-containing protein [Pandoraea communis]MDM8354789.1 2Fe-2S iron-sulfur cluster binding domain-containing protein [Pandoraea communis]VVD73751.1 CadS [Pandoraea communis]